MNTATMGRTVFLRPKSYARTGGKLLPMQGKTFVREDKRACSGG